MFRFPTDSRPGGDREFSFYDHEHFGALFEVHYRPAEQQATHAYHSDRNRNIIGTSIIKLYSFLKVSHLKILHDAGYIHRDLKPDNLLLACEDLKSCKDIALIDFGLARNYRI